MLVLVIKKIFVDLVCDDEQIVLYRDLSNKLEFLAREDFPRRIGR